MPAFTAIAAIIISEVGGITLAAAVGSAGLSFLTSVVATGLAIVTSRLISGVGASGGSGAQNQGVRIQLPPATENKVPVIYGSAFTQGIVTDARISNENKTMTYVLTLGEVCETTSTYTVGGIYWNDQKLNFATNGYTVESSVLSDGTTSTSFNGLIRTWVYAGGSSSTYQIFGPSTPVPAYSIVPDTTSSYAMTNLIFAVMQLDYNSDKGVTALPAMTFELTNSLKNPGLVWLDYMTSQRYGAGFSSGEVDLVTSVSTTTSTSLYSISNQIPPNQYDFTGITTSTQKRYEINGVLSTGDTVKTNLDKINLASASWTTYDHKLGQWRVTPNYPLTTDQLAGLRVFDDDVIIGDLTVTATNLEDIYNQLEVTYANRGLRDQSDYFRSSVDAGELNALEPVNVLRMQTALCNNGIHAARIGLIELKQSRVDLLITFQTDYSGLQTEAGDVIKVTSDIYGFNEKLFRVTRVRETEGADGTISSEITALEYKATIYADEVLLDGQNKPYSDIPSQGTSLSLPPPSTPVLTSITTSTQSPRFTISTTIDPTSGPTNEVQLFYATTSTGNYFLLQSSNPASGTFAAGQTVAFPLTGLGAGTYLFKARTGLNSRYSSLSNASNVIHWSPTIDYGSIT
jgi:hypothetical protein